jgi:hypothetical protein
VFFQGVVSLSSRQTSKNKPPKEAWGSGGGVGVSAKNLRELFD